MTDTRVVMLVNRYLRMEKRVASLERQANVAFRNTLAFQLKAMESCGAKRFLDILEQVRKEKHGTD